MLPRPLPDGGAGYRLLRFAVRGLLRVVWRLRVEGLACFPRSGPFIIACNHPSEIDPLVLAAAVPFRPTYLASKHLEEFPVVFWLVRQFDPVFVTRGLTDVRAMRACLSRLSQGEVIVIFPEGRVVQDAALGPLHRGAAFLAFRGQAPIIPVALLGTAGMWPLGARWPRLARLRVRVGAPIAWAGNGRNAEELTQRIRSALGALIGLPEGKPRPSGVSG